MPSRTSTACVKLGAQYDFGFIMSIIINRIEKILNLNLNLEFNNIT